MTPEHKNILVVLGNYYPSNVIAHVADLALLNVDVAVMITSAEVAVAKRLTTQVLSPCGTISTSVPATPLVTSQDTDLGANPVVVTLALITKLVATPFGMDTAEGVTVTLVTVGAPAAEKTTALLKGLDARTSHI